IISRSSILIILAIFSCSGSKINDTINGGFEGSYNGDNPDGWFANNLPLTRKYAKLSVDNSTVHSGDKSILISISDHHPQEITVYNWIRRIDGLKVGNTYELQGWVKTEKLKSSPFIEVQFWNSSQMIGTASTTRGYLITGTKNWQLVKTIFSVPNGTLKILIRAGISSSRNNGGKVWFDDIQIQNVE
ncbi:MAG: carbohydrate binding domain-containing protein, partial [Ignavibacteria bacterium]|nr:carbohydrate binding domain-containing protein [Ignavibacteria bacterium]